MKVKRVLIIEGPPEWVRITLKNCIVAPNKPYITKYDPGKSIRETERTVIEE